MLQVTRQSHAELLHSLHWLLDHYPYSSL